MSRISAIEPLDESSERGAIAIDLGAELLKRGRGIDLVVGGESMWPLVRHGDRVRLEPAVGARLGQLAAVLVAGHLVVHRVVRVEGGALVLQGDNGGLPDTVERARILGVVVRQERAGRKIGHAGKLARLFNVTVALVSRATAMPWRVLGALARTFARLRG